MSSLVFCEVCYIYQLHNNIMMVEKGDRKTRYALCYHAFKNMYYLFWYFCCCILNAILLYCSYPITMSWSTQQMCIVHGCHNAMLRNKECVIWFYLLILAIALYSFVCFLLCNHLIFNIGIQNWAYLCMIIFLFGLLCCPFVFISSVLS